jgi:predicted nucleic acid-binding protein
MKGLDKVLIDTSVWIEFFKKKEPYYSAVLKLLAEDKVCCTGIILAELMQEAKTEKELQVIKEFISVFEFLEENVRIWEKSGSLSFMLRKSGQSAGLSDCHIAVLAAENGTAIFTLDKHFETIKDNLLISLYFYE